MSKNFMAVAAAYDRENQAAAEIIMADTTGKYDGLPRMWAAAIITKRQLAVPDKTGDLLYSGRSADLRKTQQNPDLPKVGKPAQLALELAA